MKVRGDHQSLLTDHRQTLWARAVGTNSTLPQFPGRFCRRNLVHEGWRNLVHEGHEGHPGIHGRSSWDGHCGNSSLGNANPGLLTTDEPQNQRAIKALLWARNTSSMSWLSLSKHTPRPPSDHLHSLPIKHALFWAPFCQTILSMFYVNCSCHIYKWQKSLLCYRIKF